MSILNNEFYFSHLTPATLSSWSKAFYNMKRAQGMKHHAAVRALAYKWIRIIFHMWKTETTYNDATDIEQLKRNNSPILQFLEA